MCFEQAVVSGGGSRRAPSRPCRPSAASELEDRSFASSTTRAAAASPPRPRPSSGAAPAVSRRSSAPPALATAASRIRRARSRRGVEPVVGSATSSPSPPSAVAAETTPGARTLRLWLQRGRRRHRLLPPRARPRHPAEELRGIDVRCGGRQCERRRRRANQNATTRSAGASGFGSDGGTVNDGWTTGHRLRPPNGRTDTILRHRRRRPWRRRRRRRRPCRSSFAAPPPPPPSPSYLVELRNVPACKRASCELEQRPLEVAIRHDENVAEGERHAGGARLVFACRRRPRTAARARAVRIVRSTFRTVQIASFGTCDAATPREEGVIALFERRDAQQHPSVDEGGDLGASLMADEVLVAEPDAVVAEEEHCHRLAA